VGFVDPEGGGWVTRLRNHFESEGLRVDQDTDVYNLSISGDNTDDLTKHFAVEMEAREPDMVIFAIGINDSQFVLSEQKNRVSLEKFRENLSRMIEDTKNFKCKVYLVGLTRVDEQKTSPIPWNTDKEYKNEYIAKYDDVLVELSDKFEGTYIDVSRLLEGADLEDGLHPNSNGHIKLFEKVRQVLESDTA